MSKSVSPLDVEDVLSSIRRLVSDDTRSPAVADKPASPAADVPAAGEKLILTDALRVPGEPEETGLAGSAGAEGGDDMEEKGAAEATAADDRPARTSADMAADDSASGTTEAVETEDPEVVADAGDGDAGSGAAASEQDAEKDEEAPQGTLEDAVTADDGLADEQDAADAAATADPDWDAVEVPAEDDSADEPAQETPDTEDRMADDYAKDAGDMEADVAEAADTPPEAATDEGGREVDIGLTRRLHLTAMIVDEPDAGGDPAGDAATEESRAADDAALFGEELDEGEDAEDEEEEIGLFDENGESILDEEALREMIVQTVREQLTGELGERMTRNVRKLVRREIQRALASREFE
ncbi:hypothetical protein [Maritimibacter sp. 55A14]|uniref:hypothetical protein n=1 Tax=Maritimibacter sp. 55A14 TaxID=2174844 RepID=UPI0011B20932|nr:hypothetical protein [Maritimibacter sp. 55A14]